MVLHCDLEEKVVISQLSHHLLSGVYAGIYPMEIV